MTISALDFHYTSLSSNRVTVLFRPTGMLFIFGWDASGISLPKMFTRGGCKGYPQPIVECLARSVALRAVLTNEPGVRPRSASVWPVLPGPGAAPNAAVLECQEAVKTAAFVIGRRKDQSGVAIRRWPAILSPREQKMWPSMRMRVVALWRTTAFESRLFVARPLASAT